jgi:pimeloyl-ACP methyl ester carboxylesterase
VPFSKENLADDVVCLLGAMVGFALSLGYAERLSSLMFMASQGALPTEGIARARGSIAEMRTSGNDNLITLAGQTDAMLRRLLHDPGEAANPERVGLLGCIIGETMAFGQTRAYEAIFGMNYDGWFGEIRTPTLVLASAEDS